MNLTAGQSESLLFLGLGVLVVLATSLLKKAHWSTKTNHAIAVVVSAVTGYVSTYFQTHGTEDLTSVFKHSAYLYAASQLLYTYVLGNTSMNDWLTKFNLIPGGNVSDDASTDGTSTAGD